MQVKLKPRDLFEGDRGLMLGAVEMCSGASDWLRSTFPKGATFREAWEACPHATWARYMVRELVYRGGEPSEYDRVSEQMNHLMRTEEQSVEAVRRTVSYEQIETWLRKVMAGRPEVIE